MLVTVDLTSAVCEVISDLISQSLRFFKKMASKQFFTTARSLSTSATHSQMIKPPVQVFGMEGRYACALYSAGSKLKQLETIEKDLNSLQFKTNKKIEDFFLNPVLQRQAKAAAIQSICENSKFSSGTTNLLVALAENGRLKKLNSVINGFKTIMSAHRGDLPCEIVAAKPLDDQTIKALQGVLKSFAKKGENIILDVKVDPSIIGGLIVSIGDKYVDMSIASKVKKYTSLLQTAA
ncbi:hypothetical protein LSTR_LSTR004136 [Laodelphax striatellus]|uniref:Oligomycin sensitivity conferral protein n=1 Tax=Laodelphax striatellus TaxID=195883 RepID=A0A482WGX9_LAOST|nr:hypothetical protein LSTR_LSTR004136 [Laodelphax striatellus]